MHAMQYEITLPIDYDMGIIRHRVATRGSGTDDFGGLGLKAYGVREAGVDGSTVNQYAPFYLWVTPTGLNDFLFGPGFAGLCHDFGRPAVRHWVGLAFEPGPGFDQTPRAASRTTIRLATDSDLAEAVGGALDRVHAGGQTSGVHSQALAVDPLTWEIVAFTLWAEQTPDDVGIRYEVLHTSTPHLNDLRRGRHW